MPPDKISLRPNQLLFLATLLLLIQSLPFFSPGWTPSGDTLYRYQVFHWYYSEFFFHNQLPLWMPYGTYGMPAYFHQLSALTPAAYLTGLLGRLFQVTDTLFLYNWVAILESFSFVLGVHLLAGHLFKQRIAHLFVLLGATLSLTWWGQPYFNLQAFYGLPWVIYFLIRCREEGRFSFLWIAGITEIVFMLGNFIYVVILHFWLLLFFLLPVLLPRRSLPWPRWQFQGHWYWLALMLLLATAFSWFTLAGLEGIVNLSPGRDSLSQQVSWQEFFLFARHDPQVLLFNQLTGAYPNWEIDSYGGLLPLLLFPYTLINHRSPWLTSFAILTFFLLGLSLGYVTPYLIYHLPAMDHYRHISQLLVSSKIWIIFIAGFALQSMANGEKITLFPWKNALLLAILLLMLASDGWLAWQQAPWPTFAPQEGLWLQVVWARLAVYTIAALLFFWFITEGKPRAWLLLALLTFDLTSYQLYAAKRLPLTNPPFDRTLFQATPLPYLTQRTPHSGKIIATPFGRSEEMIRLFTSRGDMAHNFPIIYTFAHLDPCYPQTRLLLFSSPMVSMLKSRGGQPAGHISQIFQVAEVIQQWLFQGRWQTFRRANSQRQKEITVGGNHMLPAQDPLFWQTLGCKADKMRMVKSAIPAKDEQQAVNLLATLPDPFNQLVIHTETLPIPDATSQPWQVVVNEFNSNRVAATVTLAGTESQWLSYGDSWHPHWRATVDEKEVTVYRAQVGFKAIPVPPGTHQVVWFFHGAWVGFCANLLALVAILASVAGIITVIRQPGKNIE